MLALLLGLAALACAPIAPPCGAIEVKAPEPVPEARYLLVEARAQATVGKPSNVEISDTAEYQKYRKKLRTASIHLPDSCLNQNAAQLTGQGGEASPGQSLVTTTCGTLLSELEKAMVHGKFRVISWDSQRGMERQANLAPFEAAKRLKADVLFLFNSLSVNNVPPDQKNSVNYRYFDSNDRGTRAEQHPLPSRESSPLREYIKSKLATGGQEKVAGLAAVLDVTAILTETGESMWFYRNTARRPLYGAVGGRFLFASSEGKWLPAAPKTDAIPRLAAIPISQSSAEDVEQTAIEGDLDPFSVMRLDLMRLVAKDFINRFRAGTPGDKATP